MSRSHSHVWLSAAVLALAMGKSRLGADVHQRRLRGNSILMNEAMVRSVEVCDRAWLGHPSL